MLRGLRKKRLELKRKQDKIHQQAKASHCAHLWRLFRQIRNESTDGIRKRKSEHLKELDNLASCNENFATKNWWKVVKTYVKESIFYSISDITPIEVHY